MDHFPPFADTRHANAYAVKADIFHGSLGRRGLVAGGIIFDFDSFAIGARVVAIFIGELIEWNSHRFTLIDYICSVKEKGKFCPEA